MDTKYQSRIFSGILLLAALICIALSVVTGFEKKINLQENSLSYFHDSPDIKDMVLRYAKNLQRYFIYYGNFDVDAANEKLNEIDNYINTGKIGVKPNNYTVNVKPFISNGEIINESENQKETSNNDIKPESLYNISINGMTVDTLLDYQSKLSDAISNYNSVKDYINSNNDFHFILYSNQLGHIIATNVDGFYNEECYESISLTDEIFDTNFNGETLSNSFRTRGLSCEISIPLTTSNDVKLLMSNLHRQLSNNKVFSSWVTTLALAGAALLLVFFVFLYDRGFLLEINRKIYSLFAKIPMIISIPVFCGTLEAGFKRAVSQQAALTEVVIEGHILGVLLMIFGTMFAIVFMVFFVEHIIMLIKGRIKVFQLPDIVFISRGISDCRLAFGAGKIFFALLMGLIQLSIVALSCILFLMITNFLLFFPYILMLWLIIFSLIIVDNVFASEVKLRYYIQQMSEGNMEVVPEQRGLFSNSINKLNSIREHFQQNLDETLRSERLKTDLITNVSHDLKTPLTSIISYVDLLSAMDNNSDEAKEYIEIIKNKSRRLKTLIDDLFEASKLSSGQMKLQCLKSDIVSLIEQTLGELSYKIESSGIEFVVTGTKSPIMVYMDGERMWRVFDNLINNILKYSPRDSRAYIDITENDEKVIIVFKNVANYHMEFQADELFERFKRGDSARTTEGSGLGLSIAKSIVELHKGTMNIVTDGDLFKIKVELFKNFEELK
ncbi:MAG: sensor histidine kinase [Lachnospirales bacterium]